MTPCKNKECKQYQEYEYSNGSLTYPFERDAVQNYSASRKGDRMYVVHSGVILCPLCSEFKAFDLNTVEKPVKKAKKKGK